MAGRDRKGISAVVTTGTPRSPESRIMSGPGSRGRDQGAVAVVEGADAALAQPAVADAAGQAHQLGQGLALLAHPVDPGAAARAERRDGRWYVRRAAKLVGEHERVLDRHAATLSHYRRHGVGSVADEHHPPSGPGHLG